MNEVDESLLKLDKFENALGHLKQSSDRFINSLVARHEQKGGRLKASGNVLRFDAFGQTFVAIAKPVIDSKGWAMEFVFRRQLADGPGDEIWRFYLDNPSDGSNTPDVFAEATLQTRMLSGQHGRVGDFIAARIADALISRGMDPTPEPTKSAAGVFL